MDRPPRRLRPVAIAGVGETLAVPEDPRSIPEMVLHAVDAALADAGIGHGQIDAVVTASIDLFDGLTASNIAVTEVVGAVMKPETRIAADGLCAALQGVCQIGSGAYRTVLVVAHGKPSMAEHTPLTAWAMDPIYLQPVGANFLVCAGLQADAVASGDPEAPRRWAAIAARRRSDAAQWGTGEPCDADSVLASPLLASPLRAEMCAPLADNACAVVLRAPEPSMDGELQVTITGVGHDLESHSPGDRDLARWDGLARACDRAYSLAAVEPTAFDLLEPSCRYPHEEELFIAASGVGNGGATFSPSGGLFAGDTPAVAGLSRLVAATRWLRDNPKSRRALAHGSWGPAGQGQVVAVLETPR